jgi:large subunit ribosomal protein L18
MSKLRNRKERRGRVHLRVRKAVAGSPERPRLVVYRSLNHVYAQLVDDLHGVTLAAASTREEEIGGKLKHSGNRTAGREVGKRIAARAKEKGIDVVIFDRAGFRYHGVVKELADAAREAGLKF